MDAARLENILKDLEAEAAQAERRLWISPDGDLLGTRAGLYAVSGDLLRVAEGREPHFLGKGEASLFAGRLGGIERIRLEEGPAELEKEAAGKERMMVWTGRISVVLVAVLGLLFLFFFWMWWFSPL